MRRISSIPVVSLLLFVATAGLAARRAVAQALPTCSTTSPFQVAARGPGSRPHGVATGDLNRDGREDFVLAESGDGNPALLGAISVHLQTATGTFVRSTTVPAPGAPYDVALVDLNADGELDLVIGNHGTPGVSVALASGGGAFGPPATVVTGIEVFHIAVADLHGDGRPDLVLTDNTAGKVFVVRGIGGPVFSPELELPVGGPYPAATRVVDINRDGLLDLATTVWGQSRVALRFGQGSGGTWNGTFSDAQQVQVGSKPWGLDVTDVSGDGIPDLLVGCESQVEALFGSPGPPNGVLYDTRSPYPSPRGITDVEAGSFFLGDGVDLVALVATESGLDSWTNFGGGTSPPTPLPALDFGFVPIAFASADFDRDGDLDYVVADYGGDEYFIVRYVGCHLDEIPPPPPPPGPTGFFISWASNGVPVASRIGNQADAAIVADGAGGAYVAWKEATTGAHDVRLIRLAENGSIRSGWPAEGVALSFDEFEQAEPRLTPDGTGGAYVLWSDFASFNGRVRLQRVLANGVIAPGWPPAGLRVCDVEAAQTIPAIAADEGGGVLVAWVDGRAGSAVYATRIRPDGTHEPAWGTGGQPLYGPAASPERLTFARLAAVRAGGGGAMFSVDMTRERCDPRCSVLEQGVILLRAAVAGSHEPFFTLASRQGSSAFSDFGGGMLLAYGEPGSIFGSRIDPSGAFLWSVGLSSIGPSHLKVVAGPDGGGGAFYAWLDGRRLNSTDLYGVHIDPDGQMTPGWTSGGSFLCCSAGATRNYPAVAQDRAGGAFLVWSDGPGDYSDLYVMRLPPEGSPGGENSRQALASTPGAQVAAAIASTGPGAAIVVWEDGRRGADFDIYAQRLVVDLPVAVLVSALEPEIAGNRVQLRWAVAGDVPPAATVERSSADSGWAEVGRVFRNGSDRFDWSEDGLEPGRVYRYRLGLLEGDALAYHGEVVVNMPARPELDLLPPRPNPASGPARLALDLPAASRARLEVLDVLGRNVHARELGLLSAGRHDLVVNDGGEWPAGVYLARVTVAGVTRTRRFCVLR